MMKDSLSNFFLIEEMEQQPQLLNLNHHIPFELLQAILLEVAQNYLPSRLVCPFVCHKWHKILNVLPRPQAILSTWGPHRPAGAKAMAIAARRGHLSMVKWFHH